MVAARVAARRLQGTPDGDGRWRDGAPAGSLDSATGVLTDSAAVFGTMGDGDDDDDDDDDDDEDDVEVEAEREEDNGTHDGTSGRGGRGASAGRDVSGAADGFEHGPPLF